MENEIIITPIEGGVCAASGFSAAAVRAGIKETAAPDKLDLTLILSETDCAAAAVFTNNKVKGAPIVVSKNNLENENMAGKFRGIIANSGNANTCTENGVGLAEETLSILAAATALSAEQFLIASTGVIGQCMKIDPFKRTIPVLAEDIKKTSAHSIQASDRAAKAIMTTDTVKKEYAVTVEYQGKQCRIGGIAKGSGMINPDMATLLVFITTDANISSELLQKTLSHITNKTFNRVSIDGDTSTNDTVFLLANGNETEFDEKYEAAFYMGLFSVMEHLAKAIAADGEGATKKITCMVLNAPDDTCADAVAKSVISSDLLKAAIFAGDANWGRILCAVGYAPGSFNVDNIDVAIVSETEDGTSCGLEVCCGSKGVDFDEEYAHKILSQKEITIAINLNDGFAVGEAYGCDLTYDYVKINAEYRS